MKKSRPTTIAEYIRAAPREGQPHLRRLYAILKRVAPQATRAPLDGSKPARYIGASTFKVSAA